MVRFQFYFLRSSLFRVGIKVSPIVLAALLCAGTPHAQDNSSSTKGDGSTARSEKSSEQVMTKLRIQVTASNGKPVSNASVYVRYNKPGGFLRKDKLAELDLKTNGEGSVNVPPVPQGQIMIQVIATGWHTYGKWYEIDKDEDSIDIKLEPPTRWY
jgi:hypothetical protein